MPDASSEAFRDQARRDSAALDAWYAANPDILSELEDMQSSLSDEFD